MIRALAGAGAGALAGQISTGRVVVPSAALLALALALAPASCGRLPPPVASSAAPPVLEKVGLMMLLGMFPINAEAEFATSVI